MVIGSTVEHQAKFQEQKQQLPDVDPSSPSKTQQCIVFPYVGPPGTGPGLLGSRPGVGNIEYLNALEQHAASLKSALMIAATLKNGKNKNFDVEIVYESHCDIESELNSEYDDMSSH